MGRRTFTRSFKVQVVRELLAGGVTQSQLDQTVFALYRFPQERHFRRPSLKCQLHP